MSDTKETRVRTITMMKKSSTLRLQDIKVTDDDVNDLDSDGDDNNDDDLMVMIMI